MALKKSIAKLDHYFDRLKRKKADKIKPAHVEKMLEKLKAKRSDLLAEIETAKKPAKKERLSAKLDIVHEQIKRAKWLKQQINNAH